MDQSMTAEPITEYYRGRVYSGTCAECGRKLLGPKKGGSGAAGYGMDKQGRKICFKCIGKQERKEIRTKKPGEKHVMYLSRGKDGKYYVSNWPGSVKYPVLTHRKGRHNIGGSREDVWFKDSGGHYWHGVQIGDMNQICYCKRLKRKPVWMR